MTTMTTKPSSRSLVRMRVRSVKEKRRDWFEAEKRRDGLRLTRRCLKSVSICFDNR